MKKTFSIILGLVLCLSCLTFISAYTVEYSDDSVDTSKYPADTWLGRLFSKIKQPEIFSGYGIALQCSEQPIERTIFLNDLVSFQGYNIKISKTVTIKTEPGESILINWFRGAPYSEVYNNYNNCNNHASPSCPQQFMEEIYLGLGSVSSYKITCDASAYWDGLCYYEIYSCPNSCLTNHDCDVGTCNKNIVSSIRTPPEPTNFPKNIGVCSVGPLNHKTEVYKCSNGKKTFVKNVTQENIYFCNDPTQKKYLLDKGVEQCLYEEPEICIKSQEEINKEATSPTRGCVQEGKSFYTNGEFKLDKETWAIAFIYVPDKRTVSALSVDEFQPGFSEKYWEDKNDACCEGLTPVFKESKQFEDSKATSILSIFGFFQSKTVKGTYDVYVCEKDSTFCLEFAHRLLSPYTKSDCMTNSIIFIVGILLLLIILGMIGGRK